MEAFEATLQEMIDCDMRAHLDALGATNNSPIIEQLDHPDLMVPPPPSWSAAYADLEPGLFVNPQTAMPHQRAGYGCASPAAGDAQGEPAGGDAAPPADAGVVDGRKVYPKPAYSYSCLIAMALKNSKTGSLPVSEIYGFMTENFPYFKTAPNGWKNSVRHNLSLNKCFEKVEKSSCANNNQRKGCLWTMNPSKIGKMDEEVLKWSRKDPQAIKRSMAKPENLELLAQGCLQNSLLRNGNQYSITNTSKADLVDGELDILDTNLHLDSSLPDLNLQTGIWDEFEDTSEHNLQGSFVCNIKPYKGGGRIPVLGPPPV